MRMHNNVSITLYGPSLLSLPPLPSLKPYRMESRQAATTEKNRALTWVASSRWRCRMEAGRK